jgi:hypothetical protein
MIKLTEEYAIVDNLGYYVVSTHLECRRGYIALLNKEEAQRQIYTTYPQCKIKKMKVR